jgi:hypothetical protein
VSKALTLWKSRLSDVHAELFFGDPVFRFRNIERMSLGSRQGYSSRRVREKLTARCYMALEGDVTTRRVSWISDYVDESRRTLSTDSS